MIIGIIIICYYRYKRLLTGTIFIFKGSFFYRICYNYYRYYILFPPGEVETVADVDKGALCRTGHD